MTAPGATASLTLRQYAATIHPDVGPTTVWGYLGPGETPVLGQGNQVPGRSTYLGPTLVAQRGNPVDVTYQNSLPTPPLLPADLALVPPSHVDSRIHTHLHGGRIESAEDGNPNDAYPPGSGKPEAPPGSSQTMHYANEQGGTLLWYHDHALGITRTNVYAGLAGGYLLTEPNLLPLNVPTVFDHSGVPDPYAAGNIPLHIPLVIQDKNFDGKGALSYPFPWAPEFFGDNCLVNGRAYPFLEVQPRVYRFTFLNGSQSRFYNLGLTPSKGAVFASANPITQIGVELGPLDAATPIPNILIAPAERADVIIDFRGLQPGQSVVLSDGPLPAGVVSPTRPLGDCMEFRVVGPNVPATGGPVPAPPSPDPFGGPWNLPGWTATSGTPRPGAPVNAGNPSKVTFEEILGRGGKPVMAVVNGTGFMERDAAGMMTNTPTAPYSTEVVQNGATVDWVYLNLTADSHPFHTHLAHFEVISRQTFNAAAYSLALDQVRGQLAPAPTALPSFDPAGYPALSAGAPLGPVVNAPPQEKGPKDTVIANPGEITHIRLKLDLPGTPAAGPRKYVFHCHILEHEENEMMRPLQVNV